MAEWNDIVVMSPESPPTDLIDESASELAEVLHARPDAPADIRAVLEHVFGVQLGPESWEQARRALVDGFGANPAGLLMWMSVQDQRDEDRARRLERLESTRKPEVINLIRGIRALYGSTLQEAWDLFGEMPSNWRSVDREIYVDIARGRAVVRLTLTKFNGEKSQYEGPADAFLNLAGYLSAMLATIGDSSGYAPTTVDYYLENTRAMTELLRPPSRRRKVRAD
jgi:hypothetical protein